MRRLLVVLAVATVSYLFRAPLLRAIAGFLVVDEGAAPATYALPLDGLRPFRAAIDRVRADPAAKVLLVEPPPRRLVTSGIVPPDEVWIRQSLGERARQGECVRVIACARHNDWDRIRALGRLLEDEPQAQVVALCERFHGRRWRRLRDTLLPADAATRVHLVSVSDPTYDETDWWRHKNGCLALLNSYLGYGYIVLHGEDEEWRTWELETYEKALR